MLEQVKEGFSALNEDQMMTIAQPLRVLETWDYRFAKNSVAASIYEAWELMLGTYMFESKIEDIRLRRGLSSIADSSMFMYRQISKWSQTTQTKEDFCEIGELGSKNTCQEMMAFTLVKAVEDLTIRLGPFDHELWKLKFLKVSKYDHPFGATPLRSMFEDERGHEGGKRTASM